MRPIGRDTVSAPSYKKSYQGHSVSPLEKGRQRDNSLLYYIYILNTHTLI